MEVERKFIVDTPPDLTGVASDPIEQGYLAVGADGEVRLRRRGDDRVLTVKRGSGLSRAEEEIELDPAQFERLWPLTEGRRLRKRRHVIPHDDLRIELDVYEDELEGLRVAEVEFPDERAAGEFDPPPWLGRDVTGEEAYLNENLAAHGLPR
ncbi:MAG TPA: CYTH domain-containing protein [Solirubrobacterales bacterium]|jgi:CYTH domain-containing protein|nr:CYTH domain-containing protein [Solirubrobacterales bacterium]